LLNQTAFMPPADRQQLLETVLVLDRAADCSPLIQQLAQAPIP
jgi:hypothetical protein